MTITTLFARFFNRKPRLDHSNAQRRIEALALLDETDRDTFIKVAQEDADLEVRTVAVKKLSAVEDLAQFLDDVDLADEVVKLICVQIDFQHPLLSHERVRQYMFDRIESGKELVELAQRQTSPEAIAETIFSAKLPSHRKDAVELITQVDVLHHCERISRNKDKALYRNIRDRVLEIKRLQTKREETFTRAEQLIDSATRTSATDTHYESLRDAQEKSWDAILDELTNLNDQLRVANIESLDLDMLRTRFPKRVQAATKNGADPHRFAEIVAKLKASNDQDDALEDAEREWLEALRLQRAPLDISNEFFELTARIRSAQKNDARRGRLAEVFERIKALELALPDTNARENWPEVWTVRKRAKEHSQNIERFLSRRDFLALDSSTQTTWREQLTNLAANSQSIVQRVDDLLDATFKNIDKSLPVLKEHIDEGSLQQALSTERHIRNLILQLPETARKKQFDALAPFSSELKQLLNWRAFATKPKREELCERIEALAQSPLEPQQQFNEMRTLRAEWNALGSPSNRDEVAMQKRYDIAAENAWQICAEWFEQQKQIRIENGNRKEALARKLEQFAENNDWESPDWREVQHLLSQHLKQFKEIGEADRSRRRSISKRFFNAYQAIRDRLTTHREATSKAKGELIERARKICEDEHLDDYGRIEQIKSLQAEWKTVGATFHKAEERLWSEFRELCNSVFESRRMQREERKETISRHMEDAQILVDKLLQRALKEKQNFNVDEVHEVEKQLDDMVLPTRIRKDLDRKLAQVDDLLADQKQAALQMQVGERLRLLLEKDVELSGYEATNSAIPVEWYDAIENDMVLFESRVPLNDDSTLLDVVLRAEIQADIEPTSTEDEERRLQLRVGELATTMGRAKVSKSQIVETLIRDWVGIAHGEQPLRERFNRAIDVLISRLGN